MIKSTYEKDDCALKLPITQQARKTAQQFASQQPNWEKARQVRLNTLAVWIVNDYLQMMDIGTQLTTSDSWNPVVRLCADVADLEVISVGRLECRPVSGDEQICSIPPETWEERVGYVVVQVDEALQEGRLLGFVPSIVDPELPLSHLQPPEALIEHLGQLRQTTARQAVNLIQWFSDVSDPLWQTVESLLSTPELRPAYTFRGMETVEKKSHQQLQAFVRRAKLINLEIYPVNQLVMLIVEITQEANQQLSIRLQLHTTSDQIHLPTGIQLTVLDEVGKVFIEAVAGKLDNYLQLKFRGESQEPFSVVVALNDFQSVENFML